jgi:hypothetical protein
MKTFGSIFQRLLVRKETIENGNRYHQGDSRCGSGYSRGVMGRGYDLGNHGDQVLVVNLRQWSQA